MLTRVAAAAVGLLLVVPVLVFGGPMGTLVIVGIAGAICVHEYAAMAFPDSARLGSVVVGVPLACAALADRAELPVALGIGTGFVVTFGAVALCPGASLPRAAERLTRGALGVLWIGLLGWVPAIRDLGGSWVVLLLVVPWCSDTGGYFAGRYFGRRPLHPVVSPKKTVEGALGSLLAGAAGGVAVAAWGLPALSHGAAACLGAALAAVSVVGDLAESLLKRAWGVKDTGGILPGHGGLLDRIDSVLFAAPWVYWVGLLFEGRWT